MKRNSRPKSTPQTCETLAEYARLDGISRATATRRNRSGMIVWNDDRKIDIPATRQLVREMSNASGTDPRIIEARLSILQAEAKLRTLRLRQREHELIEVADVESAVNQSFVVIKIAFSGMVPWLANELLTMDRKTGLRDMCIAIDGRLEEMIYSAYVGVRAELGNLVRQSSNKALRQAAETWKTMFGTSWQEKGDVDEVTVLGQIKEKGERERAVKNAKAKSKR